MELLEQMVQGKVSMAAAGGIDDPENPIGTDAMKVLEAIESVYVDEGVVVLMDLGSALLSAEMALEFLPPDRQTNVYLCEAPLVEGAMAAAVQASVGGSVDQVIQEARGALAVKADQLGLSPDAEDALVVDPAPSGDGESWRELRLTVRNRLGLHARPAARFVGLANRFESEITVHKGDKKAGEKQNRFPAGRV